MKESRLFQRGNWFLVVFNLICVLAICWLFLNYNTQYHKKLYEQNISSIHNLNRSSANIADAIFTFRTQKVDALKGYIEANDMTLEEALDYLQYMTVSEQEEFEIIGTDAVGCLAKKDADGQYISLSYEHSSYGELQALFAGAASGAGGATAYTPEFTDAYTAFKSFAFYSYVGISDGGTRRYYTLMCVSRSDDTMNRIQQSGNYADISVALFDADGNYIIRHPNFKSENFFKYLYVFNHLSRDEMNTISDRVLSSDSGTLTEQNSVGEDCVFVYNKLPGEQWYSVSCVPLASFDYQTYGSGLTILVAAVLSAMLVLNILWLNRMNRRLKLVVASEKKANEAKTEFLSRMSHDIRTPLNAIIGFTSITEESPLLAPQLKGNLSKINNSSHYLLGILNDVLDMSKIESGKVELHEESTDCLKLFGDILEIFSGEAQRKKITLKTDFDLRGSRYLSMDALRTKQIFSNILSNAIKFSDAGTEILWTASEEETGSGRVRLVSAVTDHGCGMSPEFLQNLFDPFTQEQNIHSSDATGTGLGLAIVGRLVALMGGSTDVKSKLGEGTRFQVTLEFSESGDAAAPEARRDNPLLPPQSLTGKRVLLCEDNALNREIAVTLLQSLELQVETAENGKIGLELFSRSGSGYYDIILMDIRMPEMNGLEAASAIRALDRSDASSVPIIAMTADTYDKDVQAALDAGMNAHLAKPFEPKELFSIIQQYLGGRKGQTAAPGDC